MQSGILVGLCRRPWKVLAWTTLVLLPATLVGCHVPQPRGDGQLTRVVEPKTQRPYYLYLPADYVKASDAQRAARKWPIVVSFHGMKPYDIAWYQAREWEQEADRYGFIVIAPEMLAFDSIFGQFPQREVTTWFREDEQATLAILDHVCATTRADKTNVLSTGFSSGGYMAHYMINRHPDRFNCLAVRQSNYSSSILDPGLTSRSLYHPIMLITTENDVGICKQETQEAIRWYEGHGYKNFGWVRLRALGHERTPDLAAALFSRVAGVEPTRPPAILANRQAIDGNAAGLALLAGKMNGSVGAGAPPVTASSTGSARSGATSSSSRNNASLASTARTARPVATQTPAPAPRGATIATAPTPARGSSSRPPVTMAPLGIRVSSAVGFQPLHLTFAAECPADWHRTADFHWTLNGDAVGNGVNGRKTLAEPGEYRLELLVVTAEGQSYRAHQDVRVLRPIDASARP